MDELRRLQLADKKRHLQLRVARAETSRRFREVAPLLCQAGVRFSKATVEQGRRSLGKLAEGPGQDERLLWGHLANGVCMQWASKAERDRLLAEAISACSAPHARVAVIWHTNLAGMRIRAADLALHAAAVIDGHGDSTWIVDAAGADWLIEVAFWDREICYSTCIEN